MIGATAGTTAGTIAVTGAASGLGAALTARLVAGGARVVGVDRPGTPGPVDGEARVDADLATPDGRDAAVAAVLDACDGRLDGLVPAAGLGPQVPDPASIVAVNYFGVVALVDGLEGALGAAGRAGRAPAVVAIASHAAMVDPTTDADVVAACLAGDEDRARAGAAALAGHSAYATSKLAVARMVRARAGSWGERGVRLNAVAPGAFDSPLLAEGLADPTLGPMIEALPIPLGARATPDAIAAVVQFLLGPDASFVHGAIVVVDGGSDALLAPERVP